MNSGTSSPSSALDSKARSSVAALTPRGWRRPAAGGREEAAPVPPAARSAQARRLRLGHLDDLGRLVLGRLHAIVAGALRFGDALAHPFLGLAPEPIGRLLGRGDDSRDALGGERCAGRVRLLAPGILSHARMVER